jgi:hypothetical protein
LCIAAGRTFYHAGLTPIALKNCKYWRNLR